MLTNIPVRVQPTPSGPTGLIFNQNAAQPDQNVEMTGCLWFGWAELSIFLLRVFTAAFKFSPGVGSSKPLSKDSRVVKFFRIY